MNRKKQKCHFETVTQSKPCPFPRLAAPGLKWMFPIRMCDPQAGAGTSPASQKCGCWVLRCLQDRKAGLELLEPMPGPSGSHHGHRAARAAHGIAFVHQSSVLGTQINSSPPWVFASFLPAGPDPTRVPCALLHTGRAIRIFVCVIHSA